jgi:hypothetical protein
MSSRKRLESSSPESHSGPDRSAANRLHGFLEVIYRFPDLVSFALNMSEKGTSQFLFVTHG